MIVLAVMLDGGLQASFDLTHGLDDRSRHFKRVHGAPHVWHVQNFQCFPVPSVKLEFSLNLSQLIDDCLNAIFAHGCEARTSHADEPDCDVNIWQTQIPKTSDAVAKNLFDHFVWDFIFVLAHHCKPLALSLPSCSSIRSRMPSTCSLISSSRLKRSL